MFITVVENDGYVHIINVFQIKLVVCKNQTNELDVLVSVATVDHTSFDLHLTMESWDTFYMNLSRIVMPGMVSNG